MRRGGKVGVGLLVLLLVLAIVLVVVDRVALGMAESKISAQAKQQMEQRNLTLTSDPKTTIAGWPFLTQVAAGKYQKVTITVDKPKVTVAQPKATTVQLENLTLVADTVHANAKAVINGNGSVVADKVTGTLTLGWDAVRQLVLLAGLPSAIDPSKVDLSVVNDKIQIKLPITVQNFHLTVVALGTMVVDAGKVKLKLDSVNTDAGSLPPIVENLIKHYANELTATLNVPQLPYALVINKVQSSASGLLVIATANTVKLSG